MARPRSSTNAPRATKLRPTRYQDRILRVPETYNLFLGGGRGGGKSHGAGWLVLRHLVTYAAKAKVLVVRQTHKSNSDFEDLIESLLIHSYGAGRVRRNRQDHVIEVQDSGSVEFGQIEAQSYPRYQGREFSLLVADEVGTFTTMKWVDRLRSNLRVPGVPPRVVLLSNPGGPLHSVLHKRYVSGRVPWRPFAADDGDQWVSCPSVYTDNPHLDHERYRRQIAASVGNDRALAEAWLKGSWDSISGAFFSDVLSPDLWFDDDDWRPTGPGWSTSVALDWGWSAPSVALLAARAGASGLVGPSGRVIPVGSYVVIDELATADPTDPNTGLQWPPQMLAEEILSRCKRWGVRPMGVGDDARGLESSTLLDQLRGHGLSLVRPTKDRISGWVKLKSLMAAVRDDDPDQPWVLISTRARYLAETLPIVARNELRPEDLNSTGPDHGADALRYLVASDPGEARAISYDLFSGVIAKPAGPIGRFGRVLRTPS
jgi:hypothetical protein